jgi:hypothetical protein
VVAWDWSWTAPGVFDATGETANITLPQGETTVTLRVTDNVGATATTSLVVDVSPPPSELLLIASGSRVLKFDATDGSYLGDFISGYTPTLAYDIEIGPDGDLYVIDYSPQQVHRFDGETGVYKGLAVQFAGEYAGALAFGPDGNIYLGTGHRVTCYDRVTGEYLRDLLPSSTEYSAPTGMLFSGDDLFVSFLSGPVAGGSVYRFDAATGANPQVLASGLPNNGPRQPFKTADGRLLIPVWQSDYIARFSAADYTYQGDWNSAGSANRLAAAPDGSLLVLIDTGSASFVQKLDMQTGALLETFIARGVGGMGRSFSFTRHAIGPQPPSVIFADSNLEAAIRSKLNIPAGPITQADMETITNLDLKNLGITDLSGLETATNLRILNIRGNPFTDATATWAILDGLSLYCLYSDLPRPGGNSPGLITQAVTTTSAETFYIVVDSLNLPTLNITGLGIDTSEQSNLDALQVFVDAGVTVEGLPVNQAPTAVAGHSVLDIASGQVQLDGSASTDPDGSIAGYEWTWSTGSSSGVNPTVTLPIGNTSITLTVTDDQGAGDSTIFTVSIVDLNLAYADAGLTGADAEPDAEPFSDGVSNLVKYAFNMNLGGPDSGTLTPGTGTSGLPTYALDSSGSTTVVRVQYIRRSGSGLVYTPLKSGDLQSGTFEPMNGTETSETLGGGFERVTVVAPCDPATEPSCFWRVRVTLP